MKGLRFVVLLVSVGLLVGGCAGSRRLATLEKEIAQQATELGALRAQLEGVPAKLATSGSDIVALRQEQAAETAGLEEQKAALSAEREARVALEAKVSEQLARMDALALEVSLLGEAVQTEAARPEAVLRVGYLDTESAFAVFTDKVKDLRQAAVDRQTEIVSLQQGLAQGKISKEDYATQANRLQVDLLQAQLGIDMAMIDKLIAAPGFSDLRADLEKLRDGARPVVDEMESLVSTVRVGVVSPNEFQIRYAQVKSAFTQLDQLLTQAATVKIVRAAEKVASERGYDLVLRTKNVVIYRNQGEVTDLTELVKVELATYLE